jgi:hypothetical protein
MKGKEKKSLHKRTINNHADHEDDNAFPVGGTDYSTHFFVNHKPKNSLKLFKNRKEKR